ncbi:MAG TPA: hypothetical protein VMG33_12590 [Steroidobacteraceae bacterium]|nr:hypothetical protein [Steroidobacteraceae bacterium]
MGNYMDGAKRWWRPSGDTLEALTEVLSQRWRAAASLSSRRLWPAARRWLRSDGLTGRRRRLTT